MINEEKLIQESYETMKCKPIFLYTPNEIKKAMRLLLKKYKELSNTHNENK